MTERGSALMALFQAANLWTHASTNLEGPPEAAHEACGKLIAAALDFAAASGWAQPLEEMREAETTRIRRGVR